MCDDYYTDDCDTSLSVTWIVVIIVCVIIKIVFWSMVCYRWRRRTYYRTHSVVVVQPTHTVVRPGQPRTMRGIPVTATHTATAAAPHYPAAAANITAPPAYSGPTKKPTAPDDPEPPAYSDMAPLLS